MPPSFPTPSSPLLIFVATMPPPPPLPPWRAPLAAAIAACTGPLPSVGALATVTPAGTPAVRSVNVRGWPEPSTYTFISDGRSAKAGELAATSATELCFHFPDTREQYRLSGEAVVLGPASRGDDGGRDQGGVGGGAGRDDDPAPPVGARPTAWRGLGASAREWFFWGPPGAPLGTDRPSADAATEGVAADTPPDAFVVVEVQVVRAERLQLGVTPFVRTVYEAGRGEDGGWSAVEVNP